MNKTIKNKFEDYLIKNGQSKKVASDIISRLKRLEIEFKCDLYKEYIKNKCADIVKLLDHNCDNSEAEKYHLTLPVGKYYISTYRTALKKFIKFLGDQTEGS